MHDIIKTISDYAGFVVTGFAALALLIKPVRRWFVARFKRQDSKELIAIQRLDDRVTLLDRKVDKNEMDRLKDELFRVGNAARRGEKLISEEYRNFCENYEKYRRYAEYYAESVPEPQRENRGNCGIAKEYEFVCEYYNHGGWVNYGKAE